jgi:glycosyltransferase involved in cell wall biosynthesis
MKPDILLVLPTESSFMRIDEAIIKSGYRTRTLLLYQNISKWKYLSRIFYMAYLLLTSTKIKIVFIWFADYHAAPAVILSKVLGKKTVMFIGGYDAVCYPEFEMGVYCSSLRGFCASISLRNCNLIISNHQALLSSENTYYREQGHPEGIYRLIPSLATPSRVIYNAVSSLRELDLEQPRQAHILTVGSTPRLADVYNKGYDLLLQVAHRRPDLKFIFVGISDCWVSALNRMFALPDLPNVEIHPFLPQEAVFKMMQISKVYAQPSISEGMPNALMEAMLNGCIPVGSEVAGIVTIIANYGYVVPRRDSGLLETALDQALASETDPRTISLSISDRFGFELRKSRLLKIMDGIADANE